MGVAIAKGGNVPHGAGPGALAARRSAEGPDTGGTHASTVAAEADVTVPPAGQDLFQIQEGADRTVLRPSDPRPSGASTLSGGTGKAAAAKMAVLTTKTTLCAHDFVVI